MLRTCELAMSPEVKTQNAPFLLHLASPTAATVPRRRRSCASTGPRPTPRSPATRSCAWSAGPAAQRGDVAADVQAFFAGTPSSRPPRPWRRSSSASVNTALRTRESERFAAALTAGSDRPGRARSEDDIGVRCAVPRRPSGLDELLKSAVRLRQAPGLGRLDLGRPSSAIGRRSSELSTIRTQIARSRSDVGASHFKSLFSSRDRCRAGRSPTTGNPAASSVLEPAPEGQRADGPPPAARAPAERVGVELRGIEPLASTVRLLRSTNWSYSPRRARSVPAAPASAHAVVGAQTGVRPAVRRAAWRPGAGDLATAGRGAGRSAMCRRASGRRRRAAPGDRAGRHQELALAQLAEEAHVPEQGHDRGDGDPDHRLRPRRGGEEQRGSRP